MNMFIFYIKHLSSDWLDVSVQENSSSHGSTAWTEGGVQGTHQTQVWHQRDRRRKSATLVVTSLMYYSYNKYYSNEHLEYLEIVLRIQVTI